MVGHGGSSAGSYLADPTSPIPSHCASIVATSTLRVNTEPTAYLPWYRNMLLYSLISCTGEQFTTFQGFITVHPSGGDKVYVNPQED